MSNFNYFVIGTLAGTIGSFIMNSYIYRNVDDGKVDLIEGYYVNEKKRGKKK